MRQVVAAALFVTVLVAFGLSPAFADRGPGWHNRLETLSCAPVTGEEIDESVPAPVLVPGESCAEALTVAWQPVEGAYRYFIGVSASGDSTALDFCELVEPPATSYTFTLGSATGQFHYWVYTMVLTSGPLGYALSNPSSAGRTVVDQDAPRIDSLTLSDYDSGETTLADQDTVKVEVAVSDASFLAERTLTLQLSASPDFASCDLHTIGAGPQTFDFVFSPGQGRRTVYARASDCAGHVSDVVSDYITFGAEARSYPCPFNPLAGQKAHLVFYLGEAGHVTARIYDRFSSLVRILEIDGEQGLNGVEPGSATEWDGRNGRGEIVATGVYICHVDGPGLDDCEFPVVVRK